MLHDILDDDHIQWHPPLIGHYTNFWPLQIWTLLPNLTFSLIVQGFHRTYATGTACQQRTLTPRDVWSCPPLGLACVLMSRPISPELILSPDFWISNIPSVLLFCYINIDIDMRFTRPRGRVKSDRLLDRALQCKTIIQYLNFITPGNSRFISHREHNTIRNNIDSALCM